MKPRLLLSAILAGLALQPASAETRKAPVSLVVQKQIAKSPAAPGPPGKKSGVSAKPAPVSAPGVKPPAAGKKRLSLKALFSRKTTPTPLPPPAPAPKPAAVTVKKSLPVKVKAKPVPVIRRDPGEFIDISFPAPRARKSSIAAINTARG